MYTATLGTLAFDGFQDCIFLAKMTMNVQSNIFCTFIILRSEDVMNCRLIVKFKLPEL